MFFLMDYVFVVLVFGRFAMAFLFLARLSIEVLSVMLLLIVVILHFEVA